MATLTGGGMDGPQLGSPLRNVANCPHCGIAHPSINGWTTPLTIVAASTGMQRYWALYACTSCAGALMVEGKPSNGAIRVTSVSPEPRSAHVDLPPQARTYLNQAFQTLGAPDAAALMAGSAVDAMLKALGYEKGSVYSRIDEALADHKLTEGMATWAHAVRLGANRPRHADKDAAHVSAEEAGHSVEFAEALGTFLFVLTARVQRGIKDANK